MFFFCEEGGNSQNLKQQKNCTEWEGGYPQNCQKKCSGPETLILLAPFDPFLTFLNAKRPFLALVGKIIAVVKWRIFRQMPQLVWQNKILPSP